MLRESPNDVSVFAAPNLWLAVDAPQLRDLWPTLHPISSSKVTLWKFYLASLIAKRLLEHSGLSDELRKAYSRFLVRWGLVREVPTRWQALLSLKLTVGVSDYLKTEVPPKAALAVTEIEYIIHAASNWLEEQKAELWLCLDSLDEVSLNGDHSDEVEELLSELMKAVGELFRLPRLKFKLFFRTDIYNALTYVNKDHFSAVKLELRWSKEDLAILLGHRLAVLHPEHSGSIRFENALQWINEVFCWENRGLSSFEDLYQKLRDGNGDVLPRDLIKFCIEAQKAQLNFDLQGINAAPNGTLISCAAGEFALRQTALAKLTDFLQVFQNYSKSYDQLKGHHSRRFNRQQLAEALGVNDTVDAQFIIADLARVGAIAVVDRKAVNYSNAFEIPYMYALALEIGEDK